MIKKTKLPQLNNPILIAAWPGMGNVSLKAAHYLREELNAREYQKIEPQDFFPIPTIFIRNALIESIRLPESKFYFWKNKDNKISLDFSKLSTLTPYIEKEINSYLTRIKEKFCSQELPEPEKDKVPQYIH